jgi:hypothetical protein
MHELASVDLEEETPEQYALRYNGWITRRLAELLAISHKAAVAFAKMTSQAIPAPPASTSTRRPPKRLLSERERPILQIGGRNLFAESSPKPDDTQEIASVPAVKKRKAGPTGNPKRKLVMPRRSSSGGSKAKVLPDGKKLVRPVHSLA